MNKDKLFLLAMQNDLYKRKEWVISAFAMIHQDNQLPTGYPYRIFLMGDTWKYHDPETKEYREIFDHDGKKLPTNQPVYRMNEKISVTTKSILNLDKPVETRYGVILVNYLLLIYPFGTKIPFINGEITAELIESKIAPLLVDYTEPDFNDPKKIKIQEYREYVKACSQLEAFCQICVPTITEKSLRTNPETPKAVAEMKERYKDNLNDPKYIAAIDAEVEKLDRDWIKGDPSERFIRNKGYKITRKKLLGVYGGEAGLGDGSTMTFVDKPLTEGVQIDKMPEMINSLRSGSYDRGQSTALGGVKVKEMFRAFQNSNISEKDCGSGVGVFREVRKDNKSRFIGFYYLDRRKPALITEENIESLVGKTIEMRSPGMCKTSLTDYCEVCMGVVNSRTPNGLGAAASQIGSMFMGIFMSSMHGKVLSVVKMDLDTAIT